jgi:hypothetical protein
LIPQEFAQPIYRHRDFIGFYWENEWMFLGLTSNFFLNLQFPFFSTLHIPLTFKLPIWFYKLGCMSNSLWGQYYDKFGPKWLMKSSLKSSKSHSRLGFVSWDEWRILLSIFFVTHLTENGSWTNQENELRT